MVVFVVSWAYRVSNFRRCFFSKSWLLWVLTVAASRQFWDLGFHWSFLNNEASPGHQNLSYCTWHWWSKVFAMMDQKYRHIYTISLEEADHPYSCVIYYFAVDSFVTVCPLWKISSDEVLKHRYVFFLMQVNWGCDSKGPQTLCVMKFWQRHIIQLWQREAYIYKRQDLSFVYSLVNPWSMSWYFSINLAYFIFPSNLQASGK